jgi:antitoxin HicB
LKVKAELRAITKLSEIRDRSAVRSSVFPSAKYSCSGSDAETGAITEADSRDEAVLRAEDALESALAMYVAAKQPLPRPSRPEVDEVMVPLSALGMAKTALYDAMREQGVGRAELARRLRWHLPQVARLLDLRHASRMEHVEAALAALGLRLIVDVARAA